jgi:carbon-monoxide dehydrogenase large subunit
MLTLAFGKSQRIEDDRLITGRGQFTDDIQLPGEVYAATLRSPYGHAKIRSVDAEAARAYPGVLGVWTGADIADRPALPTFKMLAPIETPRHLLAIDRVRFVGEGVAFVVAETREAARAAAELIEVDYEELPAVATLDEAIAPGAPQLWDAAPGNILFTWNAGDANTARAAIEQAHHVTRLRVVQNRVAPTSMEVRAAVGHIDESGRAVLHTGSQGVVGMRRTIAMLLGRKPDEVRVVTKDVGGGFGMKSFTYPEYALVLVAAEKLGRPVKWTGGRSDAFLSDTHGRDMVSDCAMGFDAEGNIVGLVVESWANMGAHQSEFGPGVQTYAGGRMLGGVYRCRAIHNRVHNVATNTTPVDAYRGAGRPEATYLLERLMDAAARELGIAPDELRRKNLLRPDELPFDNGLGLTFDLGNFPALFDRALTDADWAGFPARRAAAEAKGLRYGRGIGFYVEICGFAGTEEVADVRVLEDGTIEAAIGTQANGQGHETAFARIIAQRLDVPVSQVRIVQGDTDRLDEGAGTGGSRSLQWGGGAAAVAAGETLERAKSVATQVLGGSATYAAGVFRAEGTNRTASWAELAAASPGALDGRSKFRTDKPAPVYPNGCHIAEVALDPATGKVSVERYTIVDDFGTLMNPELVVGQVHGGVAQGLGQVLLENLVYGEGAQLLTGSFMDYGIPRADDMPAAIGFDSLPVPNPNNPLGVKGCGEAGTIGGMPSIMNAIIDAIGGQQIEMPATPEKLWRACGGGMREAA